MQALVVYGGIFHLVVDHSPCRFHAVPYGVVQVVAAGEQRLVASCRPFRLAYALGRLPTVQAAVHEASLAEIVLEMTLRGIAHLYRYGTAYGLLQRLAVLPQLLFELFGCLINCLTRPILTGH